MELNRNDRRGDYSRPYEDRHEQTSEKVFCSTRKIICFVAIFVVFLILSAVVGTVISLNNGSSAIKSESKSVSNRTRKTAGGDKSDSNLAQPWTKLRLPKDIIPEQYWITQRINMSDNIFHGQVRIKVSVKKDTHIFMLHTDPKRMRYTFMQIRSKNGKILKLESAHHRNQYLVILTEETLQKGNSYVLMIKYNAPLISYPKRGLYKIRSKMVYNFANHKWMEQKGIAAAMFFPVYARKSFPCFDEPEMKALFSLMLMYSLGYKALSNMPLRQHHVTKVMNIDSFKTSLKMPTYLLNYVIFDYKPSEITTVNNTVVKVWSPPNTSTSRELALHVANVTLPYYESLFGMRYPLSKLDMVTVPEYKYGAMEYWGLINYQQNRLLFDKRRPFSHLMKKQSVTLLVAHELVHQWFGNLVTLKWWDDVIIHEGVASYFQYHGAAEFLPEFSIMEQFYNIEIRQAMKLDSLQSSKCITQPVKSTREAERNVVPLVYHKGAAILRMLHVFIGNGPFMGGFRLYLKKFAYGNADRSDLWSCISETSNIELSSLISTWTSQPGFPIITASEVKDGKVTVAQRRFLSGKNSPGDSVNQKWHVPITYVTSENLQRTQHYLLTSKNATMDIKGEWFKFNVDASGYYIVNYDVNNWNRIIQQLRDDHMVFSGLDRASIIKDAFTLADEGLLPFQVALNATIYLQKERDWIPWQYAKHAFSEMIVRLPERSPLRMKLIKHFMVLSKPILDEIGWEQQTTLRGQMLQETAISAALNAGDKQAIEINTRLFKNWIKNRTYIPDNMAKVVYFYGVLNGGEEDWQVVYKRYGYEWRDDERAMLLSALAASRDTMVLSNVMRMATMTRLVRFSDALNSVADGSRLGRSVAWTFLKENWRQIPFTRNLQYAVNTYVSPVVDKFSNAFQYNDVYRFLRPKLPVGKIPENVELLLWKIKRNVHWVKKDAIGVEFWLDNYKNNKS